MLRGAIGLFVLIFIYCQNPAFAHVKWFLKESESDLLLQPKPELFTHPCWLNMLVAAAGLLALHLSVVLGRKWAGWRLNSTLASWSLKYERFVSLAIGVFTGLLMIWSAQDSQFLVPNMIICEHWPEWFANVETVVGWGLLLGLFTRLNAAVLLTMLLGSFRVYPALDCLDLIPMYGIALYFLLVGRGSISLDYLLRVGRPAGQAFISWAYRLLRWSTGLGLVVLGLDEKLLHPQLALDVLQHTPALNFMHCAGMSNEVFVLCAGAVEILVGLVIMAGSFPRLGVLFLTSLFACSTIMFGKEELVGHMPYYGVVVALLLSGNGAQEKTGLRLWMGRLAPAFARITVYRNP